MLFTVPFCCQKLQNKIPKFEAGTKVGLVADRNILYRYVKNLFGCSSLLPMDFPVSVSGMLASKQTGCLLNICKYRMPNMWHNSFKDTILFFHPLLINGMHLCELIHTDSSDIFVHWDTLSVFHPPWIISKYFLTMEIIYSFHVKSMTWLLR